MRLSKTLTAGAVALTAALTLTGCGGGVSDGGVSGGDNGSSADSGLPKASTMAELQKFIVGTGAQCEELGPSNVVDMVAESRDPAWSIKERNVCDDTMVLLLIDDMVKFQEALAKAKGSVGRILIGQNFALTNVSRDGQLLMQNGLTHLSCDQEDRDSLPSGFTAKDGLVKPCFTTDYLPD
ncbi:hypothetical protein ABZ958_11185 [Streptomyces sp. NPDC046237]|uniref:hypothetical protein n=1 Tax=Streptomyces sp. NPDC046237 TaxID=3154914 RepID=UPI0033E22A1A